MNRCAIKSDNLNLILMTVFFFKFQLTVKGSSLQTSVDELKQQIQSSIKKDLVNVTQSPKEMADVKLRLSSLTSKVNILVCFL